MLLYIIIEYISNNIFNIYNYFPLSFDKEIISSIFIFVKYYFYSNI